jgi:hypothetical protein
MLKLTQEEMKGFVAEGKLLIWQYKTLYQICYSRNIGKGEFYLRKVAKKPKGDVMGITKKGRFMAMERKEAEYFLHTPCADW